MQTLDLTLKAAEYAAQLADSDWVYRCNTASRQMFSRITWKFFRSLIDPTQTPGCGVRGRSCLSAQQRIVGGERAEKLEFPWQISLRRMVPQINLDRGHSCGGSIINSRYVLTAAHCITGQITFPTDFFVVVGEEDITRRESTDDVIQVLKVTKHPQWDRNTLNYDYALLELSTPLDFEGRHKHLMPICLPEKDQDFEGQNCTISGWGLTRDRTEGGRVPAKLQKADVPVLKHSTCREFYAGFNRVQEDTMICAGLEEGGRSVCQSRCDAREDAQGSLQGAVPLRPLRDLFGRRTGCYDRQSKEMACKGRSLACHPNAVHGLQERKGCPCALQGTLIRVAGPHPA
ncbi:hypothetical protein HPB51_028616 [Rhipicephalus microplus]|uniref:Peptidase S1 domain-containing protein n=1 Tax=Rhipicephalus microplus TaxID=6941 RepID=A0A9J6CXC3_RHIMP|nr:hypothetical protein HPB51_028616 [Rhipicephalus microplus]